MSKEIKICSECNKPMTEGYCIEGGLDYYCSDQCLHKHISPERYEALYGQGDGDSYWTSWEE
ncbi:MAG: hypothetical protein RBQ97_11965 [Acholeplasma sp.]|nr:hypothetical protein [Acholeplasma sp.]